MEMWHSTGALRRAGRAAAAAAEICDRRAERPSRRKFMDVAGCEFAVCGMRIMFMLKNQESIHVRSERCLGCLTTSRNSLKTKLSSLRFSCQPRKYLVQQHNRLQAWYYLFSRDLAHVRGWTRNSATHYIIKTTKTFKFNSAVRYVRKTAPVEFRC